MSQAVGWRFTDELQFNGVDPNGEEPPDEIIYNSEHHPDVELSRRKTARLSSWSVLVVDDGKTVDHAHFEDFGRAFAYFAAVLWRDA